jgi:hypothetical protein
MQVNLTMLIQIALFLLIITGVAAIVQLVLILFDVRQVTKMLRNAASSLRVLDYLFDGDDLKGMVRGIRKAIIGLIKYIFKSIRRLLGGGKHEKTD